MRGGVGVGNLSDPCHMRATQNVYIFIHAMHVDVFIKNTLDDNVIKMLRCIHIEGRHHARFSIYT
nr:MAG TPA: hypothetical protein [Caudoviricetes sp.]